MTHVSTQFEKMYYMYKPISQKEACKWCKYCLSNRIDKDIFYKILLSNIAGHDITYIINIILDRRLPRQENFRVLYWSYYRKKFEIWKEKFNNSEIWRPSKSCNYSFLIILHLWTDMQMWSNGFFLLISLILLLIRTIIS